MKLIIDVPERYYEFCRECLINRTDTVDQQFIANGIPYKERPKGKWIEETDEHLKGMYRCSVCGRRVEDLTDDVKIHVGWGDCTVADIYPYCHCGADMRGDEG